MWNTLHLPGVRIASWPGVEVYEADGRGGFVRVLNWPWSVTYHQHYEVARFSTGSWWVPVSTHPPHFWAHATLVVGDPPSVSLTNSVNPYGTEYRPSGVYIWIPAIPAPYVPGVTTNRVDCRPPTAPPHLLGAAATAEAPAANGLMGAQERLDVVLAQPQAVLATPTFQDSDGLISFVNLSSDLVNHSPEYKTGTAVFDKIANFFSSLRIKVFNAMHSGAVAPLQGDPKPETQWDPAVTHYMQFLLQESGGLTDYSITTETYIETQVVAEFSTSFIRLLFDVATVPSAIISGVTAFISSVGKSLRASWDNKSRSYEVALLGQCHEAVQENSEGAPVYRYFPKLKYYHISVTSQQSEFTSDCATVRKITFNFKYEYYVTAVSAAVLDAKSDDNKRFTAFLDRAQEANYKDAQNRLDAILNGATSTGPAMLNEFDVDLRRYPLAQPHPVERRRLVPA